MGDSSKKIAVVSAVDSMTVSAILINGTSANAGRISSYVVMYEGDTIVVGTITSVRLLETQDQSQKPQQAIEIQLIGTVTDGRFERSLSIHPLVGSEVFSAEADDLRSIFSTFEKYKYSPGYLSVLPDQRMYLNPNKFFAKHIALFGSTGSGKSCTAASLLQKVTKFENTHILLLDLHGEYPPAFEDSANVIRINELELPYWLMNFEEIVETFVDESEPSANNQIMILKEAILDSKKGKNILLKDFLTIDTPVHFDFLDVSSRMRSLDTERLLSGKEGPFYGQFTRFLVRLESKLMDKRYEFLFRPKTYRSSDTFVNLLTKLLGLDTGKRVTLIDLSRVPFDVVNVLVSLLGRIIFDFNLWNKGRQDFPILIVFEEAHTYLSMTGKSKSARKTVERIAKEGRKYGVSCMIISQRPSEISETIIAQCNNFVAMRLLNPNDQTYIRKLVPDSLSNFIDVLPTLRQGEAFFIGDSVPVPVRVVIDMPKPEPASGDIEYFDKWQAKENTTDITEIVNNWWKQIRS
jgi:DNA helicase HerA-like ATPase